MAHVRFPGDVGRNRLDALVRCRPFNESGAHLLEERRVARADAYAGPGIHVRLGDRPAEALARAGDDRGPSRQRHGHGRSRPGAKGAKGAKGANGAGAKGANGANGANGAAVRTCSTTSTFSTSTLSTVGTFSTVSTT